MEGAMSIDAIEALSHPVSPPAEPARSARSAAGVLPLSASCPSRRQAYGPSGAWPMLQVRKLEKRMPRKGGWPKGRLRKL